MAQQQPQQPTPTLTLEQLTQRLVALEGDKNKLVITVGANKGSCERLSKTFASLKAVADTTASDSKETREMMEKIGGEWDQLAVSMGFTAAPPPPQQDGSVVSASRLPAFQHTPPPHAKEAVAGDPLPKGQQVAAKRKASATATGKNSKVLKKSKDVQEEIEVGTIRWDCKPMRQKGGQRLQYAVFGGGCVIAYKKGPKFTKDQVNDQLRANLDKYGNVNLNAVPRRVDAWGRYWNVCVQSVFGLFVGCLKDVVNECPLFLLEPIKLTVDDEDYAGFIAQQPQPLRAAMEAVIAETNFATLAGKGKYDKNELLSGMADACRRWHSGLLGDFEERSLTAEMP